MPKEKKDERKPVWIACRTTRPCGGQTAVVIRRWTNPGNLMTAPSKIVTYKCTQCKGTFSVSL